MPRPILADAFDHQTWANLRVIDACAALDDAQLAATLPGTYGSIIDTLRHLAGADVWYLTMLATGRVEEVAQETLDLAAIRAIVVANHLVWVDVIAGADDPDLDVVEDGDGWRFHAPLGLRLAQALLHGADHRSQICTALTSLGIEPPLIDLWDWGEAIERTRPERTEPASTGS